MLGDYNVKRAVVIDFKNSVVKVVGHVIYFFVVEKTLEVVLFVFDDKSVLFLNEQHSTNGIHRARIENVIILNNVAENRVSVDIQNFEDVKPLVNFALVVFDVLTYFFWLGKKYVFKLYQNFVNVI